MCISQLYDTAGLASPACEVQDLFQGKYFPLPVRVSGIITIPQVALLLDPIASFHCLMLGRSG